MGPYFSVILPIYNVKPFLERCVDSVLNQTFGSFELILVDDGSTDGSGTLCDQLAVRDERIRVIHKVNGGLSSARNAGTEIAVGQYIWWVDSDDWISRDALSVLFRESSVGAPDMVKFNHIRVSNSENIFFSCLPAGNYGQNEKSKVMDAACFHGGAFGLSACTNIYRREFLTENSLAFISEREIGSEDYRFNLEVLLLARELRVIDMPLYYYVYRTGSLTHGYRKELFSKYTKLYSQLLLRYRELNASEKAIAKLGSFYVWHLFHGTCLHNEYRACSGHTIKQGRRNVRSYLRAPELRRALYACDSSGFSGKAKLQILAMRWKMEPLLYWLYVVKPKLKKGIQNETEN